MLHLVYIFYNDCDQQKYCWIPLENTKTSYGLFPYATVIIFEVFFIISYTYFMFS